MIISAEHFPMLAPDPVFLDSYNAHVSIGRAEAARAAIAIVGICRNAMPHLTNTLALVDELAGMFKESDCYIYENDSHDGTAETLDSWAAARSRVTVEHATLHRDDFRGFEKERTVALAEYRNRCVAWVRKNAPDVAYVVVLDTDAHGGFSTEGVLNSVGWFADMMSYSTCSLEAGAMASWSLFASRGVGEDKNAIGVAQYDAWAARLNWWDDRRNHAWFHQLFLPVGSPPVPMNSAFGGLCLYRRDAFLSMVYAGGDCEHVAAHKSMRAAGYQLYLNPGSRYVAVLP